MIAVLLLLTALRGQSPTLEAPLPDLLPVAADLDGACELVPRPSETFDGGRRGRSGLWGPGVWMSGSEGVVLRRGTTSH